jgi:sigma-B regulation protein RsbU (phosphoserine phosphatase)
MVWTLVSCGGVYVATVVVSNALARRMAIAAAEREAVNETEADAGRVEDVLHSVEERTLLLGEAVSATSPEPQGVDRLLRRFVQGNRRIFGAALAWAPGAWRPGGEHHAVYYHRASDTSDTLVSADLASDRYRYWERQWYQTPIATGRPSWTEPYRDEGGGGVAMVTYSVPFLGPDGTARGVVTADLHLQWLDWLVRSIHLGRSGFGLILSRSGQVIAHSGRRGTDATPVPGRVEPAERARLEPVVTRMLAGEKGFLPVEVGGRAYRLTYRPLTRAGWSVAALYPEDELLEEVGWLRSVQAALALGGLALLALVVVALSRRFTRPLVALAASADNMATGDLDAALPPVESRDELGTLARAFLNMRDSLKAYIRQLRETTAAKERLEGELRIARRIQADMLPRSRAGGPGEGYELAATLVPARAVGGDLFDHFRERSRLFVLVGDVSGKGVPAALFMARTKTLFGAVAAHEGDPGGILREVNHSLCTANDAGMFVTAVCGVLDLDTGQLDFACAGHEPPLLLPAQGRPEPLPAEGGPVLGLLERSDFPVNHVRLGPREAVVLSTDGVYEAFATDGDTFGTERLADTVGRHAHEDAALVTDALLTAVRDFASGAPQSDDITILTLRYIPAHG